MAGRAYIAAGVAVLVGLASAGVAEAVAPCDADIHAFCPGLEHGHGAMQRCLQEHFGDLSSPCRAHLQGGIERARTPRVRDRSGKGRAERPDE